MHRQPHIRHRKREISSRLLRVALPILLWVVSNVGWIGFWVFVRFVYLRTALFVRRRQAKRGAVPPERLRGERRGFGGSAPISLVRRHCRIRLLLELASPLLFRKARGWFPRPSTGNLLSAGRWTACNVTYSCQSKRSERAQSKLAEGGFPSRMGSGRVPLCLTGKLLR